MTLSAEEDKDCSRRDEQTNARLQLVTAEDSASRYCRRLDSVLNPRPDGPTPEDARLAETARLFRRLRPEQFAELAKVHLAFLLDLPHFNFDEDDCVRGRRFGGGGGGGRLTSFRLLPRLHGLRKFAVRSQSSLPASSCSASSSASRCPENRRNFNGPATAGVSLLLRHLHEGDRYKTEGIFRKTGSYCRQKELQRCLLSGQRPQLDAFTVHDVASVLKQLLRCPEEPLLSERHLEILVAIGDLGDQSQSDVKGSLVRCRRLRAARLLMQLLPDSSARLLARLLRLLAAVAAAPVTRMSCSSLGTVFGPVLLGNGKSSEPSQVQKRIESLNSATAFLIANCSTIRLIPRTFAEDLKRHFDQLTAAAAAAAAAAAEDEQTPFDSAVSTPTEPPVDADVYSQKQLAELIDHVSRLPPGCRDRKIFERRLRNHLQQQQQQRHQLTPKQSTNSIRLRWKDTLDCDSDAGQVGIGRLLSFRKRHHQTGVGSEPKGNRHHGEASVYPQPLRSPQAKSTKPQSHRRPLLRRLLLLAANRRQSSMASIDPRRLVSSPKLTFCDVANESAASFSSEADNFDEKDESTVFESPRSDRLVTAAF